MQFSKRGNILLLELLIVIAFFMIGAAILMRMFGRAQMLSRRADALTRSVGEAASLADTLMGSDDALAVLGEMGAQQSEEGYTLAEGEITYIVNLTEQPEETNEGLSGGETVLDGRIRAIWQGEELLSLPVVAVQGGN